MDSDEWEMNCHVTAEDIRKNRKDTAKMSIQNRRRGV